MAAWKPRKRSDLDPDDLLLDPAASALLTQVDGDTPVDELASRTGLDGRQVERILNDLVQEGALEPAPPPGEEAQPTPAPSTPRQPARNTLPDLSAATDEAPLPDEPDEPVESESPGADDDDAGPEAVEVQATHRKLYKTELADLDKDVRVRLAERASDPVLSALCFDPHPEVIQALFKNHSVGMAQARLVAEHHRNPAGLQALAKRSQFLSDSAVIRLLMRNQQTPEAIFRRLLSPLPLIRLFESTRGREATQRAKRTARQILRQNFQRADGEEQAGLIYRTEARCLTQLVGLHLNPKAAALLCRRTYNSTIMIQNLARFPGTPPKLIEHLLRQPVVKRQVQLRNLLKRHSNCPASLKR